MNKLLLLLFFSTTLFSQIKIETDVIDLNKTGNGYPHAITETTTQKYILANLNDSIPMIFKFSSTNQNLDFLYNNPLYLSYTAKKLYPFQEKIIFHNYNFPHYLTSFDGNNFKHIAEFPISNLYNFIKNEKGYFFLNKDTYYANKLYFTDGTSLKEYNFGEYYGSNFQLEYANQNDVLYSFKSKDTIFLKTYDLTLNKSKKIGHHFVRNKKQNSLSIYNDKILFSLNEKDSNYVYQTIGLDSIAKLNLVRSINDTVSDTISIKTSNEFISFKLNNKLYFTGSVGNESSKLFKIHSDDKVEIIGDLKTNNQNHILTNNSKFFQSGNKMFFTAFKNNLDLLGSLWVIDGDKNSISLLKSNFTQPIQNLFNVNDYIYYQDKSAIYKINAADLKSSKLTEGFSEITYSDIIDNTIYFSGTDKVHGNELYTINPKNDHVKFFKEFNYQNNTNISQLLQSEEGIYFISDNRLYLFDGKSFESVSDKSPLLISYAYNRNPEKFRFVAEFDNKILFINLESKIISFDKKLKTITDLADISFYGYEYDFNKKVVHVNNRVFFTGIDSNAISNLYVTDGTKQGTYIVKNLKLNINISNNPNSIVFEKSTEKVYFIAQNEVGEVGIYSSKGIKDDFVKEFGFNNFNLDYYKIIGTYKNNLLISEYNANDGYSLFLFKDKKMISKLPINLRNHYVSGYFTDNDKMYLLYNNRFIESEGTEQGTKEIFQSNYERLFNLTKCGNSFYFTDEKNQQIFRSLNNKTDLIKKFDGDHTFTTNICYKNTIYYTNNDTYEPDTYNVRKNYIVVSNDLKFQDVEVSHILKHEYSKSYTTISEIGIFDNKLLMKYSNSWINDQSLFLGDIDGFTLNSFEPVVFNKNYNYTLFPNPSTDLINIDIKDNSVIQTINIYNSLGQLIKTIKNPSNIINISYLINGTYYIQVKTNKFDETKKIIKK